MKRFAQLLLTAAALVLAGSSHAVMIEGYTPSGKIRTVLVTEVGRLQVETSSAIVHVIVDGGQDGLPIQVQEAISSHTIQGAFVVTTSSSTCYPADVRRIGGALCNSDPTNLIYFGEANPTTANVPISPGLCYIPDNPGTYIGSLGCVTSSGTAAGYYIYTK